MRALIRSEKEREREREREMRVCNTGRKLFRSCYKRGQNSAHQVTVTHTHTHTHTIYTLVLLKSDFIN